MSNSNKLSGLSSAVAKFSNNLYVKVISQGMMGLMAVSVVGSFIMIINQLLAMIPNAPAFVGVITSYLAVGQAVCLNFVGIVTVISLAAVMAKELDVDIASSIILAMVSFILITPMSKLYPALEEGTKAVTAINTTYFGSQGMFAGMFVAILAVRIYALVIKKGITIKMPPAVPSFVAKSFAQIIPFAIVIVMFVVINALFSLTASGNLHDFIYRYLQMPLQSLGSNLWAAMLLVFLAELLWFFGIHGSMVTSSILTALFGTQAYANIEAIAADGTAEFILNSWFIDLFKGPRAIALAALLVWFCRSQHMKSVGKVALVPGLFSITEPMKFGIPMVLNPWLLIPMSLSAPICIAMGYFFTNIGFLNIVTVNVGRTLPQFISGFVACGWQGLVVQILQFIVICALYIPFLKKLDKDALVKESKAVAAEEA